MFINNKRTCVYIYIYIISYHIIVSHEFMHIYIYIIYSAHTYFHEIIELIIVNIILYLEIYNVY